MIYSLKCVPGTGFEPAHPFGRRHLKTVRLPISPPGHFSLGDFRQQRLIVSCVYLPNYRDRHPGSPFWGGKANENLNTKYNYTP